jgi:hypothetical protein
MAKPLGPSPGEIGVYTWPHVKDENGLAFRYAGSYGVALEKMRAAQEAEKRRETLAPEVGMGVKAEIEITTVEDPAPRKEYTGPGFTADERRAPEEPYVNSHSEERELDPSITS